MRRLLYILIVASLAIVPAGLSYAADGQEDEDLTLYSGRRITPSLQIILPLYFGTTFLPEVDYSGPWADTGYGNFLDTRIYQNFFFGIEMVGMRLSAKASPLEANIGLRWSLMNYSMSDTSLTFRGDASPSSVTFLPVRIADIDPRYDGTRSRIHASYLGLPVRFVVKFAKRGKAYAGASAEMLVSGSAKYGKPATRTDAYTLFSPFRATVEGGISYYGFGLWASYGLTPFFLPDCSSARTLSFGLIIGI